MMGMGADLYYSDDTDTAIRSKELYFLDDQDDYDNPLAFDFSDAGAAVMDELWRYSGGSETSYTIDDAVERFMEDIDYFRTEIAKIQQAFGVLMQQAMEAPLEEDYDREFQKLYWGLIHKQETLDMLEEDLSRLLGRDVAE